MATWHLSHLTGLFRGVLSGQSGTEFVRIPPSALKVDKHIRRLDADLARFENELKEKLELSGYESTDGRALKSESSC